MKKYLVIGNPINHSLSPKLHNYWFKKNNIKAIYEKKLIETQDLKNIILQIKEGLIHGINVTVPFKNTVIPYLDQLSPEAEITKSVNTIYFNGNSVIGHNTDIAGFELSLKKINYNVQNKKILILGSGGVVPSIIYALYKMGASLITVSNRTKQNAENLKKLFKDIVIINWGNVTDFDMIINATSVGLHKDDKINIDLSKNNNKFFYDIIYNPEETNFLKTGKMLGNMTENGKMMFIYQAHQAFTLWHKIMPEINDETLRVLQND
ncbi:MAG: shikimate dehydrogenase [Pelagibacterales bacterium MED-G42]|nr:MAG: shikimate dehydrogenase [Pelagibacterales bacterium MED-G42]|tara:strand:- start:152 stop:946 length:795 start_codon:yes stop_codon:yes gene_type:complete